MLAARCSLLTAHCSDGHAPQRPIWWHRFNSVGTAVATAEAAAVAAAEVVAEVAVVGIVAIAATAAAAAAAGAMWARHHLDALPGQGQGQG